MEPHQVTGAQGDGVWRKRLLGRLNDIDFQDFVQGVGLRTEFSKSQTNEDSGPKPARDPARRAPERHAPAFGAGTDTRPLDEVSGEVVDAWTAVDAQRAKLLLAQQSALQLAQRSRRSLMTAGFAGLVGVAAAVGIGALQLVSGDDAAAVPASRAASRPVSTVHRTASDGVWAVAYARSAGPLAEIATARHTALGQDAQRIAAAMTNARPGRTSVAAMDGFSVRSKDPTALPEPTKLSFEVALNGDGERTATLPLKLNDAGSEDAGSVVLVRNMPAGASLSSGVRLKSGDWGLRLDELDDLQVFLPNDTAPSVDLDLHVVRSTGEVVARTEIVIRTDTAAVPMTVAMTPVETVFVDKPKSGQAVGATEARSKPVAAKVVAAPVHKSKTEVHASLPRAVADPAPKAAASAAAPGKKVTDYSALGADFAKRPTARPEPAAAPAPQPVSAMGFAPGKLPDWTPFRNGQ